MRLSVTVKILLLLASSLLLSPVYSKDINYIDHVRPIFKEHCLNCHNPDKKKADLDLSAISGIQAGGSGGDVVKAGIPDSSTLYMSVIHHDSVEPMPPKKAKLSDAKLSIIRQWIMGGLIESKGGKSQLRDMSGEADGDLRSA